MTRGVVVAILGAGFCLGTLAGLLLSAPLVGWTLGEAASTVISSAAGAALAVFGAVVYELWREHHRDRIRQWKQVMLIYPTLAHMKAQMTGFMDRLGQIRGEAIEPTYFDGVIKVNVEPLAALLTDVDALDRGLAQDLLNLTGWGRQLDSMLELTVYRTAGLVSVNEEITSNGIKEVVDTVTACATRASDELERLRLKFQDETAKVEAAAKKR